MSSQLAGRCRGAKYVLAGVLPLLVACAAYGAPASGDATTDATTIEARHRLLEATERKGAEVAPRLIEAMSDERPVVRQTAAQLAAQLGENGIKPLEAALHSPHVPLRHIALDALSAMGRLDGYWATILLDPAPSIQRKVRFVLLKEHALPEGEALDRLMTKLQRTYRDGSADRRAQIVRLFASFDSMTPAGRRMLTTALSDPEPNIRKRAYEALLPHAQPTWPQARQLLEAARRDESEQTRWLGRKLRWKLLTVEQVRLPKKGWRFKLDPDDVGRDQHWHAPDHDDSAWRDDVPIETSWQNHITDGAYHGPAWYRRTVKLPAVSDADWDEAHIHFGGVDEQAWVWVNGEYIGKHAVGAEGWNKPFVLELTDAIEPGQANQITVRAQNTLGGGGIWQPVWLRLLDSDALSE